MLIHCTCVTCYDNRWEIGYVAHIRTHALHPRLGKYSLVTYIRQIHHSWERGFNHRYGVLIHQLPVSNYCTKFDHTGIRLRRYAVKPVNF